VINLSLLSTSLRMTARGADPLEKLCNAKQLLNGSAVRPNPVKPAIGIFGKNPNSV